MSAPFSPNISIAMNIVTLPPGTIMMTIVRRHFGPEAAMQVLRHRLAQRRDPRRVGIAMLAVAQSFDRRLDDMGRRFEIGLADAEIDDVAPLALQFRRPRQHGEGVLLADALEGGLDGASLLLSPGGGLLLAKPGRGGKGLALDHAPHLEAKESAPMSCSSKRLLSSLFREI